MASATVAQDQKQFEKILEQLAQRNEAVELFALGSTANPSSDDPAPSIKVRVLDVTANALVIERPLMRPGQLRLRPDMSVEAQFLVDGTIWKFQSKIRRATVHKLNRSTSVPAIELARPRRCHRRAESEVLSPQGRRHN